MAVHVGSKMLATTPAAAKLRRGSGPRLRAGGQVAVLPAHTPRYMPGTLQVYVRTITSACPCGLATYATLRAAVSELCPSLLPARFAVTPLMSVLHPDRNRDLRRLDSVRQRESRDPAFGLPGPPGSDVARQLLPGYHGRVSRRCRT